MKSPCQQQAEAQMQRLRGDRLHHNLTSRECPAHIMQHPNELQNGLSAVALWPLSLGKTGCAWALCSDAA